MQKHEKATQYYKYVFLKNDYYVCVTPRKSNYNMSKVKRKL